MEKELLIAIKELLQEELRPMQQDVSLIKTQLGTLTNKFDSFESQVSENAQILKALEHKVDVIKSEQENMKHDVAETKGDVKSLRKDISAVEIVTANNWGDIAKLKAIK